MSREMGNNKEGDGTNFRAFSLNFLQILYYIS
nr:MAG TPA: hypothetical protein [Caudoviricetes sp.]